MVLALVMGLGVFTIEKIVGNGPTAEETQGRPLFQFSEAELQRLEITRFFGDADRPPLVIVLEKSDRSFEPWQMKSPEDRRANGGAVAFLTNLLIQENIEREFRYVEAQAVNYGLENPMGQVKITLANGLESVLILGRSNLSERLIYAHEPGSKQILMVSSQFKSAIARDLSEWYSNDNNPPDTGEGNPDDNPN